MSTDTIDFALNSNPGAGLPDYTQQGAALGSAIEGGVNSFQQGMDRAMAMRQHTAALAQMVQQTQQGEQKFQEANTRQHLSDVQGLISSRLLQGDAEGAKSLLPSAVDYQNTLIPGANIQVPDLKGAAVYGKGTAPQVLDPQGPTLDGPPLGKFSPLPQDLPAPTINWNNPETISAIRSAAGMSAPPITWRETPANAVSQGFDALGRPIPGARIEGPPTHLSPEAQLIMGQAKIAGQANVANIRAGGATDAATIRALASRGLDEYGQPLPTGTAAPGTAGGGKPPPYNPHWTGYSSLPAAYEPFFQKAAATYGVPVSVLKGMAFQESGFQPSAKGDGGNSFGLMQLGKDARHGLTDAQAFDPETNIMRGAEWLAMKRQQAGGDLWKGVHNYNGSGPGADAYLSNVRDFAGRYSYAPPPSAVRPAPTTVIGGHKWQADASGKYTIDLGPMKGLSSSAARQQAISQGISAFGEAWAKAHAKQAPGAASTPPPSSVSDPNNTLDAAPVVQPTWQPAPTNRFDQ